jgi:hypothetical protein
MKRHIVVCLIVSAVASFPLLYFQLQLERFPPLKLYYLISFAGGVMISGSPHQPSPTGMLAGLFVGVWITTVSIALIASGIGCFRSRR